MLGPDDRFPDRSGLDRREPELARHGSDPPLGVLRPLGHDLEADAVPAEAGGFHERGAGAAERVEHPAAGWARGQDGSAHEGGRERGEMERVLALRVLDGDPPDIAGNGTRLPSPSWAAATALM